jgi:hypothetical protein
VDRAVIDLRDGSALSRSAGQTEIEDRTPVAVTLGANPAKGRSGHVSMPPSVTYPTAPDDDAPSDVTHLRSPSRAVEAPSPVVYDRRQAAFERMCRGFWH